MSGCGTVELKRELFSKLVQLGGPCRRETPLGAFPASSPMVAVQGQQGKQSLVLQCGGQMGGVRKGGKGVADPTGVPECRPHGLFGIDG